MANENDKVVEQKDKSISDTGAIIDLAKAVQVVEGPKNTVCSVLVLSDSQVRAAELFINTSRKNRKSVKFEDAVTMTLDWGLAELERREARLVEIRESKAFTQETANLQSMLSRGLITNEKFIEGMNKLAEKYHVGGTAVAL